jgi:hypothetical protein
MWDELKPGMRRPETEQSPLGNHKKLPDRSTQIAILKSGLTETKSHGAPSVAFVFVSPFAGQI